MSDDIRVELKDRGYEIVVGRDDQDAWVEPLTRLLKSRQVVVVTDNNVDRLYRDRFSAALAAAGVRQASWIAIPAGEASKSATQLNALYDAFLGVQLARDGVVCTLGGGVVGDLGGFAAATIHRGVDLVQVPTTLLAMVDSAIGGKTGINHLRGKNLIGAFHQPLAVLTNTDTLRTLPARELAGGLAEVIKYGVIWDPALFETLERWGASLLESATDLANEHLLEIVLASARIKADVVARDERESGIRMILNFGHTLGHAIEATAGYGAWSHGEAVSVGMVLAAELGAQRGVCDGDLAVRISAVGQSLGLPTTVDSGHRTVLADAVVYDKKVRGDAVRFVLPEDIGRVQVVPIPLLELQSWLGKVA